MPYLCIHQIQIQFPILVPNIEQTTEMKTIFSQDEGVKTETKAKRLQSVSAPKGHGIKLNTHVSIVKIFVSLDLGFEQKFNHYLISLSHKSSVAIF